MRRGARFYFTATIIAQASALVRYVILARILGVHELGLAAMLVLTAQFFESLSDTGADRFVVQNPNGHEPRMMGTVHLAMAIRGMLIAAALAGAAPLMAALFKSPEITRSLQWLAIVPLVNGFLNLDMRRVQRDGDFRAESWVMTLGELTGVAAATVAAFIIKDHTAVLYGLAARGLAMVVVSNLVAARRYGWARGRLEAGEFFRFAAPLAVNGLFLFFGSQGDRLLIANGLGPSALGAYSAILLLILNPVSAVSRFLQGIHLPQVARARGDMVKLAAAGDALAAQSLLLSAGALIGFALVGPFAAPILYGPLGLQPVALFATVAATQALRLFRGWPTAIALALGRSGEVMAMNVVRIIALPAAFLASQHWRSIYAILGGFFLGELLALIGGLWLLARRGEVQLPTSILRGVTFTAVTSVTVAFAVATQSRDVIAASVLGLALSFGVVTLLLVERTSLSRMSEVISTRVRRRAKGKAQDPA